MYRLYLAFVLTFSGLSCAHSALNLDASPLDLRDRAVTEHFAFEFYVEASPALAAFTDRADEVYRYVSTRMGVTYSGRVAVSVQTPSGKPCPARGALWSSTDGDASFGIVIFADKTTHIDQLLGVLAHELGHFLHANGFGEFPGTAGLNEGLATWAAGRYWLAWHRTPSLGSSVEDYLARGSYLRLKNTLEFQSVGGNACLERRDLLYIQWAAFTGYLITTYGVDRLKALFATADIALEVEPDRRNKNTLPSYVRIYGRTLAQLEEAWLRSLGSG